MSTLPAAPAPRRRAAAGLMALLAAALVLPAAGPALAGGWAGGLSISDADGALSRQVAIGLGKSIIVTLPRDAKEVFVANPAIANAVVRSPRKVFVIASQVGQTSLFFMDGAGQQIAALDVNVQRDVGPIRAAIHAALPGTSIVVQQLNDGVLLTGTVASAEEAAQAVAIAGRFTAKPELVANSLTIAGKEQVMLKVTVAEVQRQVLKQLGVNLNGSFEVANKTVQLLSDNPLPLATQELTQGQVSFLNPGSLNTDTTLKAFERTGVLHTLAEPTLTAISGESAHFLAGGEIPTPKNVNCDPLTRICQTELEYKPVGVTLNFTPVVLDAGRISLHVATEVTDLDYENNFVLSGANVPAFKTRKADTTVEVPSGGALVMAGLLQNNTRQVVNGTPGLMNIPVLGQLFRSRDYQRNETELMIMITPYLAKTVQPGDVSLPTDGFADAADPGTWFLGAINRVYGPRGAPAPTSAAAGRYGFILD